MARPRSRKVHPEGRDVDPEEKQRLRAELEARLDHIRAVVEAKRSLSNSSASPPQPE